MKAAGATVLLALILDLAVGLSSTTTSARTFSSTSQVYIEDTDAHGVVYNANYLRAYERALSQVYNKHNCCSFLHSFLITKKAVRGARFRKGRKEKDFEGRECAIDRQSKK